MSGAAVGQVSRHAGLEARHGLLVLSVRRALRWLEKGDVAGAQIALDQALKSEEPEPARVAS